MAAIKVEKFIEDYSKAIASGTAAVFAGAGLSIAAGYVDWKGLLRPLANELELCLEREHDLVKVAQYHVNRHSNRSDLANLILNNFSARQAEITNSHRILARLPIGVYWTTNYDSTIEDALKQAGKVVDIKYEESHLPQNISRRDTLLYKMHGDYRHSVSAVLAKEDYEKYHLTRGDFLTALAGDLLSKTFLFIGFSFTDPNMDYVLSRIFARHDRNQNTHYCLLAREQQCEGESLEDFQYRKAKQTFFIRDLERYNIRVVLLENYDKVPEVLRDLEWRFKSKTVFISGAAHEYGNIPTSEAIRFVHRLGAALIQRDYRIVTGLGLGIGSTLLDGALQQIYHVQRRSLTDQVVIRPFPQSDEGKKLWTEYRSDMLDFSGIAIFMFGNKINQDTEELVLSNGIEEEFEIAKSKGIKLLPLGFTGYVAARLYSMVKDDFSSFYPNASDSFRKSFNSLGDDARTIDEQLNTVIAALEELGGGVGSGVE